MSAPPHAVVLVLVTAGTMARSILYESVFSPAELEADAEARRGWVAICVAVAAQELRLPFFLSRPPPTSHIDPPVPMCPVDPSSEVYHVISRVIYEGEDHAPSTYTRVCGPVLVDPSFRVSEVRAWLGRLVARCTVTCTCCPVGHLLPTTRSKGGH
jgi:hypothetical protein